MNNLAMVFFGTSEYSVMVLERLKLTKIIPKLIVTTPDKPQGRKLILTPPPAKVWALENSVPVAQPEKLKDQKFIESLKKIKPEVFVVIAYGKIIPQEIIDIPRRGALNIHASLLPKYRGASPIESQILADDRNTGVTLMQIDAEMDHGPIIAQRIVRLSDWPPTTEELGQALVKTGADLLIEILPDWIAGQIKAKPQDHAQTSYTRKIEKSDGLIDLKDNPYKNFLKIRAYTDWPTAYFFTERNGKQIRVIIKKAIFKDGKLEILKVVPEGKREMDFSNFSGITGQRFL